MFSKNRTGAKKARPRISLWGLAPAMAAALAVILAGGVYTAVRLARSGTSIFQALLDTAYSASLVLSMRIAFTSTVLSACMGTILALWLWKQGQWSGASLYTIPLILPHIVAAFFIVVFFSQTGFFSSLFTNLGFSGSPEDFPVLVFDNQGTGIVLAYAYKETAFICLMVLQSLRKIPVRLIQSSQMLGAGLLRRFKTAILPEIAGSLGLSSMIIFLYSFAAFDIPYLIGSGSNPVISITAYNLFFNGSLAERPMALALLSQMWVISLVFLFVFMLFYKLFRSTTLGGSVNSERRR